MGLAGLTAVFGMGTGVTPPVWSPERRRGGDETTPSRQSRWVGSRARQIASQVSVGVGRVQSVSRIRCGAIGSSPGIVTGVQTRVKPLSFDRRLWFATSWEVGERIGVVKRSAVGTGPLRRSLAVHFRPIDLVVFQEPS